MKVSSTCILQSYLCPVSYITKVKIYLYPTNEGKFYLYPTNEGKSLTCILQMKVRVLPVSYKWR
jgi:hypothetical protein